MNTHWTYDGCDEHDEARVQQYWANVQRELEAKVAELTDVPSELRVAVAQGDSDAQWEIQAAMHLVGRSLVADSRARSLEQALDLVLHKLAQKIDRLDEQSNAPPRRREGVNGMLPLLADWHRENRSEAFISFLVPLVRTLRPYVRRELRIRENEERLAGEEISASDVLDEVLIDAWSKFRTWKQSTPLDLWLVQLADEAIGRLSSPLAETSLDEATSEPTRESRISQLDEWVEQANQPDEIELSDLLPGEDGIALWDDLDAETKQARLAETLGQVPWECRQAFVLNVAHGFDLSEIADFQGRPVAEVESDIGRAIALVRRHFADQGAPDEEEAFVRAEFRQRRRRQR